MKRMGAVSLSSLLLYSNTTRDDNEKAIMKRMGTVSLSSLFVL
jgi:hypothetical protein